MEDIPINLLLKRMKKADIETDYINGNETRDYEQEREDDNALQTHINLIGGAEYGV